MSHRPTSPAGYSGTPLPRKLGIKPGHRVALLGAPDGFEADTLGELPTDVRVVRRAGGPADVIVSFHTGAPSSSAGCRAAGDDGARRGPLDRLAEARVEVRDRHHGGRRARRSRCRRAWSTTRSARSTTRGAGCGSSSGWNTASVPCTMTDRPARGPAPRQPLLEGLRAPGRPRRHGRAAVDPDARRRGAQADRVRLRARVPPAVPRRRRCGSGEDQLRRSLGRLERGLRAARPARALRPLPDPVPDHERRRDRRRQADGRGQLALRRPVRRARAAHRARATRRGTSCPTTCSTGRR